MEFYTLVKRRDDAFLENAERIMNDQGQSVAFLIAGGYHTANLTKLLRENGYSYMVLTPNITAETDVNKYEERLLEPVKRNAKKLSKNTLREYLLNSGYPYVPRALAEPVARKQNYSHIDYAELRELVTAIIRAANDSNFNDRFSTDIRTET